MNLVKFTIIVVVCTLGLLVSRVMLAEQFEAGKDYKVLEVPASLLEDNKIHANTVMEFFNPECGGCFALEPAIEAWLKHKPKSVDFIRIPVVYRPSWELYAKGYYIAKANGKGEKILPALFHAIHEAEKRLDTRVEMETLFERFGISNADFAAAYDSPMLDVELAKAQKLVSAFKVYSIPTLLVAGQFETNPQLAKGNPKRLIAILNFLIKKANAPAK